MSCAKLHNHAQNTAFMCVNSVPGVPGIRASMLGQTFCPGTARHAAPKKCLFTIS